MGPTGRDEGSDEGFQVDGIWTLLIAVEHVELEGNGSSTVNTASLSSCLARAFQLTGSNISIARLSCLEYEFFGVVFMYN